jgi:hypothetical protein
MNFRQIALLTVLSGAAFTAHATNECDNYQSKLEQKAKFEAGEKHESYDAYEYETYLNNPVYMAENKAICEQSKKHGVKRGMTAKQVVEQTSWGKPESINRSTGSWGVHEQWVYGGRNYLYFENGKLASIQN